MATGSQNLTTYYAKRIIGDTAAANAEQALLQIGTGVNTDTWILHKTGRATDYGIKYHYDYTNGTAGDADQVQFVGKGSVTAWVQLDTGDLYVLGKIGIGYDPTTSGNTYKLYVNGTSYLNGDTTINGISTLKGPLKVGDTDTAATTGYATADTGSKNYITFYGTYGDGAGSYNHTYIGESIYGSKATANEQSELLLFHGNNPGSESGPDRIRLLAGQVDICVYTSTTSGTWDAIRETAGTEVANFANGQITITGNILPEATRTRNIGSDTLMWNNAHIRGIATRHIDAATQTYITDGQLHIGYGSVAPTKAIYLYYSEDTSSRTKFFEVNSDGAYALTRFGVNGQNTDYALYVNGTTWHTNHIYLAAAKHIYMSYNSTNYNILYNHNNGNVSLNAASAGLYIAYQNTTFVNWMNGRMELRDGCLSLFPNNSSYREGIRIHATGSWSDITLCGNDNTGNSGTSANSWFVGNNNGNFYIARNGSPGSTAYLSCVSNVWTFLNQVTFGTRVTSTAPSALTNVDRIVITPYYHTGGPWKITSRDDASNAYLSLYYSTTETARMQHNGTLLLCNNISFTNSGTAFRGINYGTMGDNDQWRIGGAATAANAGYMELATADDGNEPIYVRQYTGVFSTLKRTLTLLDANGHSTFPGRIYFSGDGLYHVGSAATYQILGIIDSEDQYGTGIRIGAGGLFVAGSGESANTIVSNLSLTAGGTETTYITSDNSIIFYPGQNGYDAAAKIEMTAGRIWAGVNGNTTRENQIGVQSGAGQIYLWSHAATSGSRGLWIPAHGSGAAKSVISVDTNNYVEFNGHMISPDASVSYIAGAQGSNAGLYAKKSSGSRWYPAVTLQTSGGGAWQIGNYNDETLEFQYATAANINSSTNSTSEIYMQNGDTGRVMTSGNYTNWCPSKTGSGASGTWGISISGTAAKATADGSGNTITSYYCTLSTAQNFTGNKTWGTSGQGGVLYGNATNGGLNSMRIGDDIYLGDCNQSGILGMKSTATNCGFWFYNSSGTKTGDLYYDGTYLTTANRFYIRTGSDVGPNSGSGALVIGSSTGMSIGIDDNEIMARSSNAVSTLYINSEGGNIYFTASSAIRMYNGELWGSKIHNAVWNDFAEYRQVAISEPGRVVIPDNDGIAKMSNARLQAGGRIISDTYGCTVGESDTARTPLGMAGRVLAYPYRNKEEYHIGDAVCSAPNGTVDIMTREEIMKYPDRIIGIVNEIPTYNTWIQTLTHYDKVRKKNNITTNSIEIKGRIWIDIK